MDALPTSLHAWYFLSTPADQMTETEILMCEMIWLVTVNIDRFREQFTNYLTVQTVKRVLDRTIQAEQKLVSPWICFS